MIKVYSFIYCKNQFIKLLLRKKTMMKVMNIDEMIKALQSIKANHGNLPIMCEYDASYWIGTTIYVSNERDPESYDDHIDVLRIS